LAVTLISIAAFAVLLHWLAFHFHLLPLPMTRTAIFLIPLCTLAAGASAAPPSSLSRALTGGLCCLACYFLFCLRLTYFEEYKDGADNKEVYEVLAKLNHANGSTETAMDPLFVAPMNFYRVVSGKETFPEFTYVPLNALPVGKSIYVLHGPYSRDFIDRENLTVVYRGRISEVVVAVQDSNVMIPSFHTGLGWK
jgi:hypothetical protein